MDPAGDISVIQRGMLGLARLALRKHPQFFDRNVPGDDEKKLLAEVESDADGLPPWFLAMLEQQQFEYQLLLDNIGGSQASFFLMDISRGILTQRGIKAETYGGLKLHSTSALLATGAPLHALDDTEMLFHAPHDPAYLAHIESKSGEPEIAKLLVQMTEQRNRADLGLHQAISARVKGPLTRLWVKWKFWRARRDKNNKLNEVTFKAKDLPGVVTNAFPTVPALAAEFTRNSGISVDTKRGAPSDRFFLFMQARRNAIRRALAEFGPVVDIIINEDGRSTDTNVGGRAQIAGAVHAMFQDEIRVLQDRGRLEE